MSENFKIHLQGTSDTRAWVQAEGTLKRMESAASRFVDALKQGVGIDLGGRLVGTLSSLPGLFKDITTRGLKFNEELHDSEIAIAQVLQKFTGLNAEAAKGEAAKAMAKIVELEPKAAGTLGDLTRGLLSTLASAQGAGVSLEKNIELVGLFANALANTNIPAEQLTQELRAIFTGNITPDAALGKMLNISNADVEKAKQAGRLYEMLKEKIGSMGEAGDSAKVAFSSLQSAIDQALGAMTANLFQQTIDGSKTLTEVITENRDAFGELGEAGGEALKSVLEFLAAIAPLLKDSVKGIKYLGEELGLLGGFLAALAGGASIEEAAKAVNDTAAENRMPKTGKKSKPTGEFLPPADEWDRLVKGAESAGTGDSGGGSGGSGGGKKKAKDDPLSVFNRELEKQIKKDEHDADVQWARQMEDAEIAIAQAKAAGNKETAKQYEDQKAILELARRYRTELELGIEEAQKKAEQRVKLERAASNAAENGRDNTSGGSSSIDALVSAAQASRRPRVSTSLGSPMYGSFKSGSLGDPMAGSFKSGSLGDPLVGPKMRSDATASTNPPSMNAPAPGLAGATSAMSAGETKTAAAARAAASEVARITTALEKRDTMTAAEVNKLRAELATLQRAIEDASRRIATNRV